MKKKVRIEPDVPLANSGSQDIIINTDNDPVSINTDTTGSYIILISDINPEGAHAVFICSKSAGTKETSVSRISSASGSNGQTLVAIWLSGESVKIYHNPIGSEKCNYTYKVNIFSAI